jgi:hypothetical protein
MQFVAPYLAGWGDFSNFAVLFCEFLSKIRKSFVKFVATKSH